MRQGSGRHDCWVGVGWVGGSGSISGRGKTLVGLGSLVSPETLRFWWMTDTIILVGVDSTQFENHTLSVVAPPVKCV